MGRYNDDEVHNSKWGTSDWIVVRILPERQTFAILWLKINEKQTFAANEGKNEEDEDVMRLLSLNEKRKKNYKTDLFVGKKN